MNRQEFLKIIPAFGLAALATEAPLQNSIMTRKIPSTNEPLPCIGLGTWQTFNVGKSDNERDPLKAVLEKLIEQGGAMVDSSPMYGASEEVVGDLSTELNLNAKLFLATKVWTSGKDEGIKQMNTSLRLLRRSKLDLMQIHNLVDWQTHLSTLRSWKEQGKIRYIGITHYTESSYASIENILKSQPIDFLQINYSIQSREAEKILFPLAIEKKVAVIINQPFEEGNLFRIVKGKELPPWASEFDCKSWAQFFLKFILSHAAVNCVIPGTSKPHHMADNLEAGKGRLPTPEQRKKMVEWLAL